MQVLTILEQIDLGAMTKECNLALSDAPPQEYLPKIAAGQP
jgi:hypothetical protein